MSTLIKKNGTWVQVAGDTFWKGTKAQLSAALENGEIADGTKVMVTNDYDGGKIPVGVVEAYMGATAPTGWLLCDGSTFDTSIYPKLYELLGSDTLPDLRESVLVGAGENTTNTIEAHDIYAVGEFKDDQMQSHKHTYVQGGAAVQAIASSGTQGAYNSQTMTTSVGTGRTGDTTHGKQTGVNYIIHAEEA